MSQNGAHPRIPDPDEQFERSRAQQVEGMAQQLAGQSQDPTDVFQEPDHWDKLASFDIGRKTDGDELEELLATEFSNKYTLGHFDRSQWEMFGYWAENEIHTAIKEFPDPDSKVTGTDYWIMYGQREGLAADEPDRAVKPPLTDEQQRRLWSAADAKRAGMTGAVDRAYLRALTEITAVSRTEREETQNKSRLERFKEWL